MGSNSGNARNQADTIPTWPPNTGLKFAIPQCRANGLRASPHPSTHQKMAARAARASMLPAAFLATLLSSFTARSSSPSWARISAALDWEYTEPLMLRMRMNAAELAWKSRRASWYRPMELKQLPRLVQPVIHIHNFSGSSLYRGRWCQGCKIPCDIENRTWM